jgi:hypothetical protein
MRWDIVSSPTHGLQLRLKPIGVIRVDLIDTAKKFGFMYSQKGIARPHSPNFHVHVPVSDLYIPMFRLRSTNCHAYRIGRPIRGIYKSLTET